MEIQRETRAYLDGKGTIGEGFSRRKAQFEAIKRERLELKRKELRAMLNRETNPKK